MASTPLLLLPGMMTDARVWDPLLRALPSDRIVVIGHTHVADNMVALAAEAIASMPDGRFAVAGFSLGGYVALEACRQAPDRVAGLALLDTSARADTDEARANRQRSLDALADGSTGFAEVLGQFPSKLFHPSRVADTALLQLLEGMGRSVGEDGFVRQQRAAMNREDRRDVLKTFHGPALVLCGSDDGVTPPERSQEMAALLPGEAELVLVPNAGHMTTLEQPSAVLPPLLRWLERVDRSG